MVFRMNETKHFVEEKNRIYDVAMELMKTKGYEKLSIREICKNSNIGTGTFYKYFSSKEQLLAHYYSKAQKAFYKSIVHQLEDKDLKEQLVSFYTWYTEYTAEFGIEFCKNFFNSSNKSMNTDLVYNDIIEITTNYINDAISEGFVIQSELSADEISDDLCVIVKGAIFDWCTHDGDYDLPKYVNQLLNRVIVGLI